MHIKITLSNGINFVWPKFSPGLTNDLLKEENYLQACILFYPPAFNSLTHPATPPPPSPTPLSNAIPELVKTASLPTYLGVKIYVSTPVIFIREPPQVCIPRKQTLGKNASSTIACRMLFSRQRLFQEIQTASIS